MLRRDFLLTTAALSAACAGRERGSPISGPQRGIAFDGYDAPMPTADDFLAIRALGASHLALFPFGYMRSHRDPEVLRFSADSTHWALTDEGLMRMGHLARGAGLSIILMPTLVDFLDGHWRGEIAMGDELDWSDWFTSYEQFLMHYAGLGARMNAVGLSVGTELRSTAHRDASWRQLIGRVRERFHGWLTYAANWDDFESLAWWDALDLVGVQAYFELGDPPHGDDRVGQLMAAWAPTRERLARLSSRLGMRVLFTEIGYKSHTGATAHPWQWDIAGVPDPDLQRAAYEAAFRVFWREPWFAGFYWWKWRPQGHHDEDYERDFTPQGKAAEDVIRRYYLSVV
jgi:hypothetical protein